MVRAMQCGAKSNLRAGEPPDGHNSQGTQPPVSYRLPFRLRETDGCGLIKTVPGTNHILVIVEIR